jgi:hypothetical protein
MKVLNRRLMVLSALAGGLLLAQSCSVADAVVETIRLALSIVNVWV